MRIADDFGLGRKHDRVILSLLQSGRLDGTSVLVEGALAGEDVAQLRALRSKGVLVGLHLNLTEPFARKSAVWSLAQLMTPWKSAASVKAIAGSIDRQLKAFVALFGDLPDYYDGHQHCHCFPGVARQVAQLPFSAQAFIRLPLPATWQGKWLNLRSGGAKVLIVMGFACYARVVFKRARLRMNGDFSGFLRLDAPSKVAHWLPRLLSACDQDCLMMLHPGDATDERQCDGHAAQSRAYETEILIEHVSVSGPCGKTKHERAFP